MLSTGRYIYFFRSVCHYNSAVSTWPLHKQCFTAGTYLAACWRLQWILGRSCDVPRQWQQHTCSDMTVIMLCCEQRVSAHLATVIGSESTVSITCLLRGLISLLGLYRIHEHNYYMLCTCTCTYVYSTCKLILIVVTCAVSTLYMYNYI